MGGELWRRDKAIVLRMLGCCSGWGLQAITADGVRKVTALGWNGVSSALHVSDCRVRGACLTVFC